MGTTAVSCQAAIVGGGLAGLHTAQLLHADGIDIVLLEARDRLGGRILSADETGAPSDDGFDLGPSWFWPHVQPDIASLVDELGLSTFPQHNEGDVIFERMSRETAWRYRATEQAPQSMRLVGGTAALVTALARDLPADRLLIGTRVTQIALGEANVTVSTVDHDGAAGIVVADQIVAAVPPRLLADVGFSPPLDAATLQRWRHTPTWMAPHAKFFAIYDRPFWREAGLSGTAQSFVGPMGEIHDATTASGKAALFGFLGAGADVRASLGETALAASCLAQLARLYGPEARQPRATLFKDWAADPLTATARDRTAGGHPDPSSAPWLTGAWQQRLSLCGSETSSIEPGFMAGAVNAARRAAHDVAQRLRASAGAGGDYAR
ncbi:MAG: flavin monoamine oxidase family protein [Vicinamibacterales bacterium]